MGIAETNLPPVDEIYNPLSIEYCQDPVPQCLALAERGRLVWYEPWQAWIMTQMDDIMDCWKKEYLSSDFFDWEYARPRPPEEEWGNFDRAMIGHSLLSDPGHHRLIRKITSPAFSRNVVDEIERRIKPDICQLFDDLGQPESFDYIDEVARHIPFISITRMVGIPEKYWADFKPVVSKFTEAWNPTLPPERIQAAVDASDIAIDILKLIIAERREEPFQANDFLSLLLQVERDQDDFGEWDIIALVMALIGAGADTTLIGQQWTAYCLAKHPEQRAAALETPDAFANTFNEVLRWSCNNKMGFARYAPEDMEVLGNSLRKGQMVLLMPHLTDHSAARFENPEKFDVTREFTPDITFGYGPRFCIGASLARRQLYLTLAEMAKRFPNFELDGEPEVDPYDHNAIAFEKLNIKTNL